MYALASLKVLHWHISECFPTTLIHLVATLQLLSVGLCQSQQETRHTTSPVVCKVHPVDCVARKPKASVLI